MSHEDALRRGAEGERRVAEILEELRPQFGFAVINDVLLDFNGTTSQIDHILIDRYGALVIETKCYGALLRGKSEERYWTACYHNGKTQQMLNPLVQNDGHRHWLSKVLIQNQRDLPERYIQSLIVFARGETESLELSGVDPLRVVTPHNLAAFIAARYDFAPNDGRLGTEAQRDLWGFLLAADKSADEATVAQHLALVENAKCGRRRKRTPTGPREKSRAELNWEARQAAKAVRKARENRNAWAQLLMYATLSVAFLCLSVLGACTR